MLAWMTYVVVVTLLLTVAAFAAERAACFKRAPVRWVWSVTIVTSLLIPAMIASVSIELPSFTSQMSSEQPTPLRVVTSEHLSPSAWIEATAPGWNDRADIDSILQRSWIVMSLLVLSALLISAGHLFIRKRRWSRIDMNGRTVLVADDIGPAVVGLLSPEIVVPRWLLRRPAEFQKVVLAHEEAHLHAHDQPLLALALCLIVLMPWNLPLWWQLRRLRYAIEVDCDARVLKSGHALVEYGETLIEVGQHRSGFIGAVAGMSESPSFLERRIDLMTSNPMKWWRAASIGLSCSAVAFVAVAASVSPPNARVASQPQASKATNEEQSVVSVSPAILERYVGQYQLTDTIVVTVRKEESRLLAQLTGQPEFEIFPESQTQFFWKVVNAQVTFLSDNEQSATALILHQNGADNRAPRIDAATAGHISSALAAKVKNQVPTPGSDAALRRLLQSIRAGKPNYEEMSPALANAVREQLSAMQPKLSELGVLQSIEFEGVSSQGWDTYQVHHENGSTHWNIALASDGKIAGAVLAMH